MAAAGTADEASRHGRDAGRGLSSRVGDATDRGSLPVDAADGGSSGRGGNGGREGDARGAAGAAAGSGGRLGREISRRHPLAPEHRATLKRAVTALWEPSGGRRRNGSGSPRRGGRDEGRREGEGEQAHGGLRASELSASIFAMRQPRQGGDDGLRGRDEVGGRRDSEEEDDWADGRAGCRGAWEQGVACFREDFEEILLELEAEEGDSNYRQ